MIATQLDSDVLNPYEQRHGGEPESKSYVHFDVAHIVDVGAPIYTSTLDRVRASRTLDRVTRAQLLYAHLRLESVACLASSFLFELT